MIYDPSRRARELRERILENMTAEEIEEYAKVSAESRPEGSDPPVPEPELRRGN